MRKKPQTLWIALVIFLVGIVIVFAYMNVLPRGDVSVRVPMSGVDVYIDGSKKETSSEENQVIAFRLSAKPHTLMLSKEGYWPWQKQITVAEAQTTDIHPFFISKSVGGSLITAVDPEYHAIVALVRNASVPTAARKKNSSDGSVAVWVEGKTLYASSLLNEENALEYLCPDNSCGKPVAIASFVSEPRAIDFYKDRSDVVLVAVGEALGALELDARGTQNWQPVYTGGSPKFTKSQNGTLFVSDGDSLSEISI